jgi:hypothetical protein
MNLHQTLALALDPSQILVARGLTPDPWQRELLLSTDRQVLLNCSRQSGKSTVVAALALHTALFTHRGLVLLLSPSQRQSTEIFRKVIDAYTALRCPLPAERQTELQLELSNGSRVICLPGREDTVRSYGGVSLLVIDEAARVPDDLYRSVRPMLAVSQGRLVALSTPFGRRGFFHDEWHGTGPWKRVRITWRDCPRITESFLAEERRALGDNWVRQEYECEFTALEGLVYPDFPSALVEVPALALGACVPPELPAGRAVGGIDWGWRNPFAAVWGVLDAADVLWIGHERYKTQTPLHEHIAALPKEVMWYADPSGATEIQESRAANRKVQPATNDIRLGIAAVTARLRTERLKVLAAGCPNLVAEAQLYRYPTPQEQAMSGENPVDAHNHALGALRYLVAQLDARFLARMRQPKPAVESKPQPRKRDPWLRYDNEELWTRLF